MVNEQTLSRRALSAELQVDDSGELETYRGQFLKPAAGQPAAPQAGAETSKVLAHPMLIPMVYPFESTLNDDQLEEHIIESLASVKKFKILLRGITGYPGGFVLLNVKAGNDKLILMHDLLHQGALKQIFNPLYTFFPHVLLFRCSSPEATRDAVVRGQSVSRAFEASVEAVRIEEIAPDGSMNLVSAIDLE